MKNKAIITATRKELEAILKSSSEDDEFIDISNLNIYKVVKTTNFVRYYKNNKLHREDGPALEECNWVKEWYFEGKFHRLDGPAIEYASGTKEWYYHGKLHRADGPAIEYASGTKEWFINDKLHRLDGPAIEYNNGDKKYYLNGTPYRNKTYFDAAIKEYYKV